MNVSEIQREKLSALYKMAALDIKPGGAVRTRCGVTGLNNIQKTSAASILPEEQKKLTVDHNTVMIFNGVSYDHMTGKVYMEFVSGESPLYYSYTDHGPFSIPFGQMLEKVMESSEESVLL